MNQDLQKLMPGTCTTGMANRWTMDSDLLFHISSPPPTAVEKEITASQLQVNKVTWKVNGALLGL